MRPTERFEILKRDNFTCQYCGQKAPGVRLHVDHRTALARGGRDVPENWVTSCYECNVGKGAQPIDKPKIHLLSSAPRRIQRLNVDFKTEEELWLLHEMKAAAAREGIQIREWVLRALRNFVEQNKETRQVA